MRHGKIINVIIIVFQTKKFTQFLKLQKCLKVKNLFTQKINKVKDMQRSALTKNFIIIIKQFIRRYGKINLKDYINSFIKKYKK